MSAECLLVHIYNEKLSFIHIIIVNTNDMCKEILILYCLLFHTEIYMFYLLKYDNVRFGIILYFLFVLKPQILHVLPG